MNARTEFQIILGKDGKPAFVVVHLCTSRVPKCVRVYVCVTRVYDMKHHA